MNIRMHHVIFKGNKRYFLSWFVSIMRLCSGCTLWSHHLFSLVNVGGVVHHIVIGEGGDVTVTAAGGS
jgi:hypothetical protein